MRPAANGIPRGGSADSAWRGAGTRRRRSRIAKRRNARAADRSDAMCTGADGRTAAANAAPVRVPHGRPTGCPVELPTRYGAVGAALRAADIRPVAFAPALLPSSCATARTSGCSTSTWGPSRTACSSCCARRSPSPAGWRRAPSATRDEQQARVEEERRAPGDRANRANPGARGSTRWVPKRPAARAARPIRAEASGPAGPAGHHSSRSAR